MIWPFIVGNARSGTTLLRAMLDSHSQLAIPWESYFITRLYPNRLVYENNGSFDIDTFLSDLAKTPWRFWAMSTQQLCTALKDAPPRTYADAIRVVFKLHAALEQKPLYGDKTPEYIFHVELIAELLPEARFIHIIRDGRDVAVSLKHVDWARLTVAEAAEGWLAAVTAGQIGGSRIGNERYYELRYESLVAQPYETLQDVCRFINIDFEENMLKYFERTDKLIASDPSPQFHSHLYLPPTIGLRNWRNELSADEITTFHVLAGELLQKLGYL